MKKDRLITLAIHTYPKALILKGVLESQGIAVVIQNVNLLKPVISPGVRVRIHEKDLPHALEILETDPVFGKSEVSDKPQKNRILIPIDFSDYIDQEAKLPQNLQVEQLISAFEKLLRRHKLAKPLKTRIVPQNISVEERMRSLGQQLKYKKRVAFISLFDRFDKEYIVVTFLALLELVKGNQISISQQNYYEDIYISSLEGDEIV